MAREILARCCGSSSIEVGDVVGADIDLVYITDGSATSVLDRLECLEVQGVFDPNRVALVIDHYVPSPSASVSRVHQRMRRFAAQTGCLLFDAGEGICHHVLGERGLVRPGSLVVGADSHSVTYGAFGALATGIGSTDAAAAIAGGRLWFRVPRSVHLLLRGDLGWGVTVKDVALHLNSVFSTESLEYSSVEISTTAHFSVADMAVITNTAAEWGAKAAIWVNPVAGSELGCQEYDLEVTVPHVEPLVARPNSPTDIAPLRTMPHTRVDLCFVGTCSGGSILDLRQVAMILQKHRISPDVQFLLAPASRHVYSQAMAEGLVDIFLDRGVVVIPPGCGPCCGTANGIPGDGQVVVSTANRNYRGRMGNPNSSIFLASPLTVAASAVTGELTDARSLLGRGRGEHR